MVSKPSDRSFFFFTLTRAISQYIFMNMFTGSLRILYKYL